jgi:AraC-like DNA-binding protein
MPSPSCHSFKKRVVAMLEAEFSMRIVPPSPRLRRYVSAFYAFDIASDASVEDLAVPEWGGIRLIQSGGYRHGHSGQWSDGFPALLQGPSSRAVPFCMAQCSMIGLGLLPEGFAQLWLLDLGAVADTSVPLEQVMGPAALQLSDLLTATTDSDARLTAIDSFFVALLDRTPERPVASDVARIHALLNNPEISQIQQLANAAQMTPSALTRFCKKRFGFAPKLLLRRQRFLRMLDALHARPYAEWPDFLDPQYVDQSHMIRDFKYFMGMTPSQYLAQPRLVQRASAANRSEALGSALQGLS